MNSTTSICFTSGKRSESVRIVAFIYKWTLTRSVLASAWVLGETMFRFVIRTWTVLDRFHAPAPGLYRLHSQVRPKNALTHLSPRLNACLVRVLICIGQWDAENRTSHERNDRKKVWGLFVLSDPFEMQMDSSFYHRPSREKPRTTDAGTDGRSKWAISHWPKEGRFVVVWLADPYLPATKDGGTYVAVFRILSWILQRERPLE